jgi:pimeloyl-ACP methyl ester carboxylesterase
MPDKMIRKLKQIFNASTELPRAALEFSALATAWPLVKRNLPDGDGHPVLFFPGFLTGDAFTQKLRDCVAEKGYKVYGWDKGVNFGFDEATAQHIKKRLKQVFDENGGQKVTLVGHSLGGIFARELAREFPEMVRGVITMGTPFGKLDDPGGATSKTLEDIYSYFNPKDVLPRDADLAARGLTPPPVPTTSLYSKEDGIVDWTAALNPKARRTENVQVAGSHTGMAFNLHTITAVLDRLAQPEGHWKPFDKAAYPALLFPANDEEGQRPLNPRYQHGTGKDSFFEKKHKPKPGDKTP